MPIITLAIYVDPETRTKRKIGLSNDDPNIIERVLRFHRLDPENRVLLATDLGGGLQALSVSEWNTPQENDDIHYVSSVVHVPSGRRCIMPSLIVGASFNQVSAIMKDIVFMDPDVVSASTN